MISQSLTEETRLLLLSLCYGGVLMAVYDILRVFRRLTRHSFFAVGAEDFFYWIFVGIAVFLFLYRENDGTIRGFVLVGIGLGMLVFSKGISPFAVPAFSWLISRVIGVPFRALKHFLKKILKPPVKAAKALAKALRKKMRKRLKKEKNCSTMV